MLEQIMEVPDDKRHWGKQVAFEGSHVSAKLFERMSWFPSITNKRMRKKATYYLGEILEVRKQTSLHRMRQFGKILSFVKSICLII